MKRIGFGLRLLAAIIDLFILGIVTYILSMILGASMIPSPADLMNTAAAGQTHISHIIISLLYFSLEIFLAATPGKLLLKLKIKNASGKKASMNNLLIRWLTKHSAQIFSLLLVVTCIKFFSTLQTIAALVIFIGCFFVFGKNRQALHDIVGKTAVYKSK